MNRLTILLYALLASMVATAQPEPGSRLPAVKLADDLGGLPDGTHWRSSQLVGSPTVLVYVHPDKRKLNHPLQQAIQGIDLDPTMYGRTLVLNTSATWKPDRFIQAGIWIQRLSNTFKEAQTEGIVQALLVNTPTKSTEWTLILDKNNVLTQAWKLPPGDYHAFLLDKKGIIKDYHKGPINPEKAKIWAGALAKLATQVKG
ncbi:MAG: hypothetical protein KA479_09215 [Saprospiraceae bacterium]|nr:hypothetical protein [Saprospiraceae bacterium]